MGGNNVSLQQIRPTASQDVLGKSLPSVEEGDSSSLDNTGETTPGMLCPDLGSPMQERHCQNCTESSGGLPRESGVGATNF